MPETTLTALPLTGINRPLAYKVPAAMAEKVAVGSLVRVPIMRRTELAVVTEIPATEEVPEARLKYIHAVEQPYPVLSPALIRLARWMSAYYAADLADVFEVMIPSSVRKGMKPKMLTLLRAVENVDAEVLAEVRKRAPKQAKAYDFLASQTDRKAVPKSLLVKRMKVADSSLKALVGKGLLEELKGREAREAYADDLADSEAVAALAPTLMPEQQSAAEAIEASLQPRAFKAHLLHGVTGSGKTEVYLHALKAVVEQGGGAIFLVPEVALTPQTVGRLRARLESSGVRAVVWHSMLSDGERFDAWEALASGEARVVVGARSAIFAPVHDLRVIIVDEEHEPAYKQEESPRYHGRDVAVYRAFLEKATVVLGSATPALESLYNVELGKYELNRITKRVDDRQLPLVHIVDMRRERIKGEGQALFSRSLTEKLRERLDNGEQAILFLNRRGFNTSMMCPDCGYVAECDHCSITLTFHRPDQMLRCHLCGHEEPAPKICPNCRSPKIQWRGTGTQRVEHIARQLLPDARIVRIDADAMKKKNLFRAILGDFRKGKIDLLVGTQMIAKGLDFPNVTLVGLIDADVSLHLPDFRAAERTFQLLVQVAGRAGRGDRSGEVVVQTFAPFSEPLQFARAQDFDGFSQAELEHRREYRYPPYRHLVHHIFRGKNPDKVSFYAEEWVKKVEEKLPDLEIRGPAPAPIEKIKDDYRFQVWYFIGPVSKMVPQLVALRQNFPMDSEVIDVFDVDPVNLI